jgi:hypothetical protein
VTVLALSNVDASSGADERDGVSGGVRGQSLQTDRMCVISCCSRVDGVVAAHRPEIITRRVEDE